MVKTYRCAHSGLLLPPDYVQQWGRKYGFGLGEKPVSECLDSVTKGRPNVDRRYLQAGDDDLMYPFCFSCAPIEYVEVTQAEFDKVENRLIMHRDDPGFERRAKIIQAKQKQKPEWSFIEVMKYSHAKKEPEEKPWR